MSDPTDVYVGARVREARLAAGLSQTTLAGMLGVAYQQIQKYENASNRISCSRIVRIAAALGRPVEWFFDEAAIYFDGGSHGNISRSAFVKTIGTRPGRRLKPTGR